MATPRGHIFVALALAALLAAPMVSAECCRGKNPLDGSQCHAREAKTLQQCQMDQKCMWTNECVR